MNVLEKHSFYAAKLVAGGRRSEPLGCESTGKQVSATKYIICIFIYNIAYYMLLPLFLGTLCNIAHIFAIFLFPFCDLCCIVNGL